VKIFDQESEDNISLSYTEVIVGLIIVFLIGLTLGGCDARLRIEIKDNSTNALSIPVYDATNARTLK